LTTNADSETGKMAVCCENLTLGVLSRCSSLSLLVGALFKKYGLFLDMPHIFFLICCLSGWRDCTEL